MLCIYIYCMIANGDANDTGMEVIPTPRLPAIDVPAFRTCMFSLLPDCLRLFSWEVVGY